MSAFQTFSLIEALRIRRGELLALVGGGGKTGLRQQLAREGSHHSWRVLQCVTAHTEPPTERPVYHLGEGGELPAEPLARALEALEGPLLAAGREPASGKLVGVPQELPARLRKSLPADLVVVEADGARKKPLKAHAGHEPPLPAEASAVVAVVGAEVLGAPLSEQLVHRLEKFCEGGKAVPGRALDVATLASWIADSRGYRKHVSDACRFVVFINKVEGEERVRQAEQLAGVLAGAEQVDRVVWGSLREGQPWHVRTAAGCPRFCLDEFSRDRSSAPGPLAVVVLAAGEGRRLGGVSKPLLAFRQGTMLDSVLRTAAAAECREVICVVGHEGARVREQAGRLFPKVRWVFNPRYPEGIGTSVAAGVRAAEPDVKHFAFLHADKPLVRPRTFEKVRSAYFAARALIAVPRCEGEPGHPTFFEASLRGALEALHGEGPQSLVQRHRERVLWVDGMGPEVVADVDTPEDLKRLDGLA